MLRWSNEVYVSQIIGKFDKRITRSGLFYLTETLLDHLFWQTMNDINLIYLPNGYHIKLVFIRQEGYHFKLVLSGKRVTQTKLVLFGKKGCLSWNKGLPHQLCLFWQKSYQIKLVLINKRVITSKLLYFTNELSYQARFIWKKSYHSKHVLFGKRVTKSKQDKTLNSKLNTEQLKHL